MLPVLVVIELLRLLGGDTLLGWLRGLGWFVAEKKMHWKIGEVNVN